MVYGSVSGRRSPFVDAASLSFLFHRPIQTTPRIRPSFWILYRERYAKVCMHEGRSNGQESREFVLRQHISGRISRDSGAAAREAACTATITTTVTSTSLVAALPLRYFRSTGNVEGSASFLLVSGRRDRGMIYP